MKKIEYLNSYNILNYNTNKTNYNTNKTMISDIELATEFLHARQSLKYIDSSILTQELCTLAFQKRSKNIEFIPKKFLTPDFIKIILKTNTDYIKYIPDEFKTKEMCYSSFHKNPKNFNNIPEEFKTEEFCLMAVNEDFLLLQNIKIENFYEKHIEELIQNKPTNIKYLNEKQQTDKLCKIAIKSSINNIKHIINPTKDMIVFCIVQDPHIFNSLDEKLQTDEICDLMMDMSKFNIDRMPSLYLIKYKIKYNKLQLKDVSKSFVTKEVMKLAVSVDPLQIKYITNPEYEIVDIALSHKKFDTTILDDIQNKKLNHHMFTYVKKNPKFIFKIIDYFKLKNKYTLSELIEIATSTDKSLIKEISEKYDIIIRNVEVGNERDEIKKDEIKKDDIKKDDIKKDDIKKDDIKKDEIKKYSFKSHIESLTLCLGLNPDYYIKEVCMKAVKENGLNLEHVPKEYRTDDILLEAVKQNVDAVKYIK